MSRSIAGIVVTPGHQYTLRRVSMMCSIIHSSNFVAFVGVSEYFIWPCSLALQANPVRSIFSIPGAVSKLRVGDGTAICRTSLTSSETILTWTPAGMVSVD
jgi:hypothetical protein